MINGEGYYRSFYAQQQKNEVANKPSSSQESIDASNGNFNLSEFLDFLDDDAK